MITSASDCVNGSSSSRRPDSNSSCKPNENGNHPFLPDQDPDQDMRCLKQPLTKHEQSRLAMVISQLPQHLLSGVVQILEQDALSSCTTERDHSVMDVTMDELSVTTQRRLFHHVSSLPVLIGVKQPSTTSL